MTIYLLEYINGVYSETILENCSGTNYYCHAESDGWFLPEYENLIETSNYDIVKFVVYTTDKNKIPELKEELLNRAKLKINNLINQLTTWQNQLNDKI